ncbi:hypothetical protein LTR86_008646 [Recurvomyces mirabilis]|nr:hypothetical protein LTR86_008646 [Recurvomyces mirabilis]
MADPSAPIPTLTVSTAVTPTDHSALITLAGWLCMVAGVLCSLTRLHIRWPLRSLAGSDDVTCGVATVLAIIQTAITLQAAKHGLGVTGQGLTASREVGVEKTLYATDLIFVLSLWIGKISVALLFVRLANSSKKTRPGWVLTGLTAVFGFISFLLIAIRPPTSHPWRYDEVAASSALVRWTVNGVLSIVVDLIVCGMSCYLVWDLQMNFQSKSLVVTAFALRVFVMPITILRLVSLSNVMPDDISFTYTLPEVFTQLEMHCNLIATTLPCLRLFLTAWNTNFMNLNLEEMDPQAYKERESGSNAGIEHIATNTRDRCDLTHTKLRDVFPNQQQQQGRIQVRAETELKQGWMGDQITRKEYNDGRTR